jgi:NAD(P)H-nitrite reductase large subunit
MKYVIIGNGAAGISAAGAIRKHDKKGSITVISDEPYAAYGRPLISYFIKGTVTQDKMPYKSPSFYEDYRIKTVFGQSAEKIESGSVVLNSGQRVEFDKLLIATGSLPFIPPISGLSGNPNVFTFLKLDDAIALKKAVKRDSRVVIVGGGLIGLKAAEGLHAICDNITVVELADRVLAAVIDKQGGDIVSDHLEKNGIKCITGNSVEAFNNNEAILKNGEAVGCDILVVAVGVRPNVRLAESAGISINKGIVTNENMQTSNPDIYAAGDCVESFDITDGSKRILALWPNAVRQGIIAGSHMAGGAEPAEKGTMPLNSVGFFSLNVMTCGITDPRDNSYETIIKTEGQKYKKFVIKDDVLRGFVLVDSPHRAGLYTALVRDKKPLSSLSGDITEEMGLINFSKDEIKKKIGGGEIQ